MESSPDDLDRLPRMRPADDAILSPITVNIPRRTFRLTPTLPQWGLLAGIALVLVCGLILLGAYGLASMIDPGDSQYSSHVFQRFFAYDRWAVRLAIAGLVSGVFLIVHLGRRALQAAA